MNQKAWVELAKSAGRFLWFGILGLIGTLLASLLTDATVTNAFLVVAGQEIQIGAVLVFIIGLAAKAIDRYVHESDSTELNGIAPTFLQK